MATKHATTDNELTKRAAQYLLEHGLATYSEIADITGRSRQIVRYWSKGIGAEDARARQLRKAWHDAIRKG